MNSKFYYTYYSYEEWGRGYIGAKPSGCICSPEEDPYVGSFSDKTFKPTQKIVLGVYSSPEECLKAEIKLHSFFEVDINPHFANRAKQTSTGFLARAGGPRPSMSGDNNPMRKYPGLLIGSKNGMYGKTHNANSKKLIRKSRKEINPSRRSLSLILIHPNGTQELFPSALKACQKHNLTPSKLCQVINGKIPHTKGFRAKRP